MDEPAGLWHASRDGMYWKLLIMDGGTGWIEYGRAGDHASVTEFTFTAAEPNRLVLTYGECREAEDGESRFTWPADEHTSHAFTVTAQAAATVALTLDPPLKSIRAFTRPAG